MPIRVLVVDDEGLYRGMLQTTLGAHSNIQVVGTAASGEEAIRMAEQLKPDVILMDIDLGRGPNGIQAGLAIKEKEPSTGIVILSMHRDRQFIANIPLYWASGWSYLLKQTVSDPIALVRAIEASAQGLVTVDAALTQGLIPRADSPLSKLTEEQFQVLELMAQGFDNLGIAVALGIEEPVVVKSIQGIYETLGIKPDETAHPRVKAVLTYLQETRRLATPLS